MRSILHGDLTTAARALLSVPPPCRFDAALGLLERAHAGHCYAKRFGRPHAEYGGGSLMSIAMAQRLPPEPRLSDANYADCLVKVLSALCHWRLARQPDAQEIQRTAPGSNL